MAAGRACLLGAALIWGGGFVAQRESTDTLGPLLFTGLRFGLGALVVALLLPLWDRRANRPPGLESALLPGLAAGLLLGAGAALQQVGMLTTSASKAGFLTGTYVLVVPALGLLLGQRVARPALVGVACVISGLTLLPESGGILPDDPGDAWVLSANLFWGAQVQVVGRFATRCDPLRLALVQFTVVGVAVTGLACALEPVGLGAIRDTTWPLLYGGIGSIGAALTLQILGQRAVPPTQSSLLMSTEALFAAAGGVLLLGERLTPRQWSGCALLFLGALIPSLARAPRERERRPPRADAGA
jgi:drug/metabolite transporter (DMT)-like permease